MHHPIADIECFYAKREIDGKGLIQRVLTYKTTTIGLKKYLDTMANWMLLLVNAHEKRKMKYSISQQNNKFANQLHLIPKETCINDKIIETAKI